MTTGVTQNSNRVGVEFRVVASRESSFDLGVLAKRFKSSSHTKLPPVAPVFLPGNKTSRNIIFAGNTLPQGAIPIQINGLNAIPLSAVKSLPISISNMAAGAQTVAKRTKVEIIPANGKTPLTSALPIVTKVTNNNTGNTSGLSQVLKESD